MDAGFAGAGCLLRAGRVARFRDAADGTPGNLEEVAYGLGYERGQTASDQFRDLIGLPRGQAFDLESDSLACRLAIAVLRVTAPSGGDETLQRSHSSARCHDLPAVP
jgi:hypothetical protein